jgi:translation initiation factor IF-1
VDETPGLHDACQCGTLSAGLSAPSAPGTQPTSYGVSKNPVTDRKDGVLSKDDLIDMQGTVVAVHSGGLYRVQCDAGHEVLAQLSGRMRRFRIKVVPGDRVTVGVSPYDPVRGIITFRAR